MQTTQSPITRLVRGAELPVAGTWTIDTAHTDVTFVARHLMVAKVRGRVPVVGGDIVVGDDPDDSFVTVTLDMAGIDTGSAERDAHLRSEDFFDSVAQPHATFRSTALSWSGDTGAIVGDLTIAGTTRMVVLGTEYLGAGTDPDGLHRMAFSASTEVDRNDWGLSWNQPLANGGVLIGRTVRIELDVQAVLDR